MSTTTLTCRRCYRRIAEKRLSCVSGGREGTRGNGPSQSFFFVRRNRSHQPLAPHPPLPPCRVIALLRARRRTLVVHNIKSDTQRLVTLVPSSDWGGAQSAGLLGVTIRLDDYGGADERLVRVLSVEHNSPAQIAGLVPMDDYLLGTAAASFDSDRTLAEALRAHADRIVELYVYSAASDVVRVATLMPTYSWGGQGLLGAEVGTGHLHRFPAARRGTDGASASRRVRLGTRPTEVAAAGAARAGGAPTAGAKEGGGEGEVVADATSITDAASGRAMRFAEQLEMEPREPSQPSAETASGTHLDTATPSQPANDAAAVFGQPPPPPAQTGRQLPLPPPPYASPRPTAAIQS